MARHHSIELNLGCEDKLRRGVGDRIQGRSVTPVLEPENQFTELASLGIELSVAVRIVPDELAADRMLALEHVAVSPRSRQLERIDLDRSHNSPVGQAETAVRIGLLWLRSRSIRSS